MGAQSWHTQCMFSWNISFCLIIIHISDIRPRWLGHHFLMIAGVFFHCVLWEKEIGVNCCWVMMVVTPVVIWTRSWECEEWGWAGSLCVMLIILFFRHMSHHGWCWSMPTCWGWVRCYSAVTNYYQQFIIIISHLLQYLMCLLRCWLCKHFLIWRHCALCLKRRKF